MFDWNDLRFFVAVARQGSTVAAGKVLGLSQSTVHRRLVALESGIGRDLFSRGPAGYRLTAFGEELLPYAEHVAAAVDKLERHAAGALRERSGLIRLTCPEPIVARLTPFIEQFHATHKELRVEFVTSDGYLDILKGEADIALRSGDTDEDLVGRKVADSIWAVYASRDYIAQYGQPRDIADLSGHRLVGLDQKMEGHRVVVWLNAVAPQANFAARSNSVLGLVSAVRSGLGIGPLPTAIADGDPDLVRVLGPVPELARSWRLLTHPRLRRVPRIVAFFDFAAHEREQLRRILAG